MVRPIEYSDYWHARKRLRAFQQKEKLNVFPGAVCSICKEESKNLEILHTWVVHKAEYWKIEFICQKCKDM